MTGSITGDSGAFEPIERRPSNSDETRRASRVWWDAEADTYQDEHGEFLGAARWNWCPEGLDEADAGLLGPIAGRRALEVGCGAGAGTRWLAAQGAALAVGLDLSHRQLQHSRRLDAETGLTAPVVCADAAALPFADACFDLAGSAYGALPFVADVSTVMREVFRVLRAGSPWVFSVTHPMRWIFLDAADQVGLTVAYSYFDRRAYVEQDETGVASYVEHHRTIGDWVDAVTSTGFVLERLVEPEWPEGHDRTWGSWSPFRGRIMPGTAIFCCRKVGR